VFNLIKAIFKSPIFSIIILLLIVPKVYSDETNFKRFVLEDRNIKTVGIKEIKSEYPNLDLEISQKFFEKLKNNSSNVKFILLDDNNNISNTDIIFSGEIKKYSSKIKPIHFSDFLNYEIFQQDLEIALEIKIIDTKTNNLIWKRYSKKLNIQRWIEFNRQEIGVNPIYEYLGIPSQMLSSITKQYNEKDFLDKILNSIVDDLSSNLVNLDNKDLLY